MVIPPVSTRRVARFASACNRRNCEGRTALNPTGYPPLAISPSRLSWEGSVALRSHTNDRRRSAWRETPCPSATSASSRRLILRSHHGHSPGWRLEGRAAGLRGEAGGRGGAPENLAPGMEPERPEGSEASARAVRDVGVGLNTGRVAPAFASARREDGTTVKSYPHTGQQPACGARGNTHRPAQAGN